MKQSSVISPSILSADFARLGEDTQAVLDAGADWVHFDVMDNHFVPNLTIGPMVCKALRGYGITAPIDVHLMVQPVDELVVEFARAGASMITFHPEASIHVDRTINLIKENGCQAGLVFNPTTPLNVLDWALGQLDMVLLMSVNPGFGGQSFIPSTLEKIRRLKAMIDSRGLEIGIEVDGGIGPKTIASAAAAGANIFVAGSAVYGSDSYKDCIGELRYLASTGTSPIIEKE